MKIYVCNLPFALNSEDVKELFSQFGAVESSTVVYDHYTERSRGFAFVKMSDEDGEDAISGLHGYRLDGRRLEVRIAAPSRVNERRGRREAMDRLTGYGPVWQPGR